MGWVRVRSKKIDSCFGRRICVTEHEGLRQAGRARQADKQKDGKAKPRKMYSVEPPFPSRAGGQVSDTPTLTAQDLGWHGFTPGQSDARRIGTVAPTLLLTMLARCCWI